MSDDCDSSNRRPAKPPGMHGGPGHTRAWGRYCHHHREGVSEDLAVRGTCRKPQPGMLLQAAADLNLDLQRSWFVGDILDDVEAGNRAGCRTVLVDLGTEPQPEQPGRAPTFVARNTLHALQIIEAHEFPGLATELTYRPANWQLVLNPECRVAVASSSSTGGTSNTDVS